jgi:hypothetical protein
MLHSSEFLPDSRRVQFGIQGKWILNPQPQVSGLQIQTSLNIEIFIFTQKSFTHVVDIPYHRRRF